MSLSLSEVRAEMRESGNARLLAAMRPLIRAFLAASMSPVITSLGEGVCAYTFTDGGHVSADALSGIERIWRDHAATIISSFPCWTRDSDFSGICGVRDTYGNCDGVQIVFAQYSAQQRRTFSVVVTGSATALRSYFTTFDLVATEQ